MDWRNRAAQVALAAALLGGVSFLGSSGVVTSPGAHTVWKGSGVGLLAVYAALRARRPDGWLIAAVMALGALGDVLLEVIGLTRGALAFLAGHLVAVVLYLRNRRPGLAAGDWLAAAAIAPATVVIAFLLPSDRSAASGIALYAAGLGAMAATAWISRFPRPWVATGALMFVASDLLIFARIGPLAGQGWVSPAVWSLYFAGQAMICLGVVRRLDLSGSRPRSRPASASA